MRMPFNFLKKSRHYNVTSKSLFVISVHHLLDTSTTVDCTLSSESTGQECLDNVCQRLSINQPEFFGLRYVVKSSKDEELRWVDLERPLSRQLEKHASGSKLYLRVMFYIVSGLTLLEDEVSRYYYFLQLKNDVVEGRISCDAKQAVILALYCRQAEYDSYQKDKHTIDYLKTLLPFPKRLIDEGMQETLTEEVLQQNCGFQNLTQSAAEELYIAACQQLDGYGMEKFLAKDSSGNEVHLGITVNGIAVCYSDKIKFYPWYEVSNVVNLKRTFNIECTNTVSFVFPDADTGRYFWKLCVLQHTFFMKYEKNQTQSCQPNLFQNVPEDIHDSREDFINDQRNIYSSDSHISELQNSVMSSNMSLATSQQQSQGQNLNVNWGMPPHLYGSSNCNFPLATEQFENRVQSTSCLDLSNNNYSQDRDRLKALLPTYRQAPDYETAVQQKYRASPSEIHINPQPSHIAASAGILSKKNIFSGSQPDVHHASGKTDGFIDPFLKHKYPDVTQTTTGPVLQTQINSNLYSNMDLAQRLQMMRLKPPPPYPANRLSSTSTPDLAIASRRTLLGYRGAYVSGSSPDLVSSRTFLNTQYIHHPYLHPGHSQPYLPHGTFENLNMIEEQPSILLPLKPPFKKLSYEKQPYRYPQFPDTSEVLQKSGANGSIEPIYENVPLPWQGQEAASEMRDRTSSIQSAPGGMRNDKILGFPVEPKLNNFINSNHPDSDEGLGDKREHHLHDAHQKEDRRADFLTESNTFVKIHSHRDTPTQETQGPQFLNSSKASALSSNTNDSGISSAGKEKRKRRWGILSRNKNSPSEKQKSATLGREKTKNKDKVEISKQEANLRHRWSTGLPRLQPLSATFSKDKLCQILDGKLNDSQLFMEFERIPKRRESARYDCALSDENKDKNSDPNFLPYDENRVRITPTMDNRMGYVNASHITATVGSKQRFYIIAQSPRSKVTMNIFWQCVWEADVYLIVQLSEEISYIPPTTSKCLEFGQFQVYQEFSQTTDRCITSKLRLYHSQSRRYRSVWHLSYSEWAEQNCPTTVGHFLDFLEELSSVRLASINEVPPGHNTNPPVLIHCNEGGGRSGVTLAADLLLYTLDHNQDLDIPRVTHTLRHQRDNIVPSLAQYKFIYALLITYLKRTRLI